MSEMGFPTESDAEESAGGYHGLYWAEVVVNNDPERMGRVKAKVFGVVDKETDWALPIGMPGAGYGSTSGGKGGFFVPRKGATILVGFIYGKIEQPFYFCAHYPKRNGKTGAPRIVQQQSKDDAPNVRVLAETDTFEVYITDTSSEKKVIIQTLGGANMIEIDAKDGSIVLKAKHAIILDAPAIQADGLNVFIKGRPVSPLGLSI